jgi:hypothetical protein
MTMVPLAVWTVTVRVSPAARAGGWLVGQSWAAVPALALGPGVGTAEPPPRPPARTNATAIRTTPRAAAP